MRVTLTADGLDAAAEQGVSLRQIAAVLAARPEVPMRPDDSDKIARYRRGELNPTVRESTEPIEVLPEVMVSRSLRLPTDVFEELTALAAEQGIAWSVLVRQWVIDGIAAARERVGQPLDPAIELQRGVEMITHAATRLRQRAA